MTSSDEGEYGTDCSCNVNHLLPVTYGQSLVITCSLPFPVTFVHNNQRYVNSSSSGLLCYDVAVLLAVMLYIYTLFLTPCMAASD